MKPEKLAIRFDTSASYASGEGGVGGSGTVFGNWLDEEQARRSVAEMLRNAQYDPTSIRIIKQGRAPSGAWGKRTVFTPAEIFADVVKVWEKEKAVGAFLSTLTPLGLRSEVAYRLNKGTAAAALSEARARALAAQQLVTALEEVERLEKQFA